VGLFDRDRRKKKKKKDSDGCCIIDEVFGDCFVATAAHDSEVAEPVLVLRAYRDERLSRHRPGRSFTRGYYAYGPYGAAFLRRFPVLKPAVRVALRPVVWAARRSLERQRL